MANQVQGVIQSVNGQVAFVQIDSEVYPSLFEILVCPSDPNVILEVYSQSSGLISCQILSNPQNLFRGMTVVGTGSDLKVPVGRSVLGRVIDLFGNPQDSARKIVADQKLSIY